MYSSLFGMVLLPMLFDDFKKALSYLYLEYLKTRFKKEYQHVNVSGQAGWSVFNYPNLVQYFCCYL